MKFLKLLLCASLFTGSMVSALELGANPTEAAKEVTAEEVKGLIRRLGSAIYSYTATQCSNMVDATDKFLDQKMSFQVNLNPFAVFRYIGAHPYKSVGITTGIFTALGIAAYWFATNYQRVPKNRQTTVSNIATERTTTNTDN